MPTTLPKIVHESHSAPPTSINIAYIGGGSRAWALHLMQDLALAGTLTGELRLYDIDLEAAQYNEQLGAGIFTHADARGSFQVRAVKSLAAALSGADFVVISIEPGPTALRHADLEIPAKYGVLQTVGDTTGPGGILRGLRCVPLFRQFAQEIMEHCPRAWVINYTNPMAICTAALYDAAPEIRAFGCCHEVFGTQKQLAEHVRDWFGVETPARQEIELDLVGVNHFTWATRATWRGHDLLERLRETIAEPEFFRDRTAESQRLCAEERWFERGLISYDLFQRFGILGAAGDRHLAEFVPWYLSSEEELHRWGVVATPYQWRMRRQESPRPSLDTLTRKGLTPSGEEGVDQIEALLGIRRLTTNVNLPNRGQIPWLPAGALVETYAELRQDSVTPLLASSEPPAAVRTLIHRAASEQLIVNEAGRANNADLAFQALLTHPLVTLPTGTAHAMFQEMLDAVREMQPFKPRLG